MNEAPLILGPIDFLGSEGSVILIEHDESFSLNDIGFLFKGKTAAVYSATQDIHLNEKTILIFTDKIISTVKSIKNTDLDLYVINRIDLFELNLPKKTRGSQIKGWVQQLNRVAIKEGLVIITSESTEYKVRDIASETYNLKLPCHLANQEK